MFRQMTVEMERLWIGYFSNDGGKRGISIRVNISISRSRCDDFRVPSIRNSTIRSSYSAHVINIWIPCILPTSCAQTSDEIQSSNKHSTRSHKIPIVSSDSLILLQERTWTLRVHVHKSIRWLLGWCSSYNIQPQRTSSIFSKRNNARGRC